MSEVPLYRGHWDQSGAIACSFSRVTFAGLRDKMQRAGWLGTLVDCGFIMPMNSYEPTRGTLLIRNSPHPPWDHHRAIGIFLLQGPSRGALFLMTEVPL
jgi:hypothetical protein